MKLECNLPIEFFVSVFHAFRGFRTCFIIPLLQFVAGPSWCFIDCDVVQGATKRVVELKGQRAADSPLRQASTDQLAVQLLDPCIPRLADREGEIRTRQHVDDQPERTYSVGGMRVTATPAMGFTINRRTSRIS